MLTLFLGTISTIVPVEVTLAKATLGLFLPTIATPMEILMAIRILGIKVLPLNLRAC